MNRNSDTAVAGEFRFEVLGANAVAGGDTITFAQPLIGSQTIDLGGTGVTVSDNLVVNNTANPVTITSTSNTIDLQTATALTFRLGAGVTVETTLVNSGSAAIRVNAGNIGVSTVVIDGAIRSSGFSNRGLASYVATTVATINGSISAGTSTFAIFGAFQTININGTVEAMNGGGPGALTLTAVGPTGTTVVIGSTGIVRTVNLFAIQMADNADVLELHPGATIVGDVNAGMGNDTLRLGGAGAASFDAAQIDPSGQYRNFERLQKTGSSVWTLTGFSTFTGPVAVDGGRLAVDGDMALATFSVNTGGTLGGTGTVGHTTLIGGTLAPGNSIGTINVAGNLTFGAGSTYAVELSPSATDLTLVTGTANLSGGAVSATFGAGTYQNRRYVILTAAGGLGGTTFTGITDNAPGVVTTLSYDANNVYIDIELAMAAVTGLNQNQSAVGRAIDASLAANGSLPGAFATLDANGLTLVSGEIATSAMAAGFDNSERFVAQISDLLINGAGGAPSSGDASTAYAPLAYSAQPSHLSSPGALAALGAKVPASDAANAALAMSSAHAADPVDTAMATRWKMWGAAYGSVGRIGGDPIVIGSADVTVRNWGIASGFDRSLGDSRVGLSLGGAGSTFSLSGGLGSGSAGIFNAGLYGSYNFGNAYVSGALAYGWNNVRTIRNVPGDTLTANFNAHTLAGRLETGYRFGSTSAITPYVALQGGNYFLPAYTETSALGGPFALAYARQSETFLRTELGARFEHTLPTSSATIKLSGRAAWAYNAINSRAATAAFVALPGQAFTVNGARPARSAALLDLGIEAAFASGVSAKLSFNGEFSRNVSTYGASAKLSYRW